MSDNSDSINHEALADKVKGYAPLNLDECQNLSGLRNDDYETADLLGDLVKAEFIDENEHGEVNRGGIWMKQEAGTRLWRIGKVVCVGPEAPKNLTVGCYIRFPSDRGIPTISQGKKYVYLNASRIFEIVRPVKKD